MHGILYVCILFFLLSLALSDSPYHIISYHNPLIWIHTFTTMCNMPIDYVSGPYVPRLVKKKLLSSFPYDCLHSLTHLLIDVLASHKYFSVHIYWFYITWSLRVYVGKKKTMKKEEEEENNDGKGLCHTFDDQETAELKMRYVITDYYHTSIEPIDSSTVIS